MKKLFYLVMIVLYISGCTAELKLDGRWLPLEAVKENPAQPSGVVTTIAPYNWVKRFPESSHHREALLRHERVHAFRQLRMGRANFIAKYAINKKFRWREEQLAMYVGLTYLKNKGYTINIDNISKFVSGPSYRGMISYSEARQWLLDMLSGKWNPDGKLPEEVK